MAILWESLVRPADITTFIRNVPLDQNYTLQSLLPNRIINDEEVNYANVTVTARTAKVRAFDAPAASIGRDTFTRSKVRPLPVTAMMTQGEVDRRRLAVAAARGGDNASIVEAIYDDATHATQSILRKVEYMRGQALSTGAVAINENNVATTATFGVPGGNVATASTLWSDPTATILDDLRTWTENYITVNGVEPGGIVMSRSTWYNMAKNTTIKALYPNQGVTAPILSKDQVYNALEAYGLPPVQLTYDAMVDIDGTPTRVLPTNKILFVPPAGIELGFTAWALTVTGSELAASGQLAFSQAAGMVGLFDVNSAPPFQKAVYVDSCPLPVITNPRALAIYTVA